MKKESKKIPDSVFACAWFIHPKYLTREENKELVITNILNRGTLEAVRWAFRFYGEKTIRKVVSTPRRSLWFPEALHFWSRFFNLSIDPQIYQKALFRLDPTSRSTRM